MAEQRKTLTMSIRRKRMPNTMQRYSSHEGETPPVATQSMQAVSGSPGSESEGIAFNQRTKAGKSVARASSSPTTNTE